jgi:hypothetical protein
VAAVLALGLSLSTVGAFSGAEAAYAAGASSYGQWSLGSGGGSVSVPVPGFPTATVSTDSTSASAPSGASAYLNSSTPFGQAFGSSQGQPYALLRTARGTTPSTTTLDFARPTAANSWGFNLGDIDADTAQISATGADGNPVSIADLGFQSVFNFCTGSPLPSTCGGRQDTDTPVWDPAAGTLTGNVADTNGASGWFRPTVAIKSLTIKFSAQTGLPVYQLWLATAKRSISGSVSTSGGSCSAVGLPVVLLDANRDPVTDASGNPVTATVQSDGSYSFPEVAAGAYRVEAARPSGATGTATRAANTVGGDAAGVDLAFRCKQPKPPIKAPVDGTVKIPINDKIDLDRPVTIIDQPEHGTVTVDKADGVLIYTPNPGYQGMDSFVYMGETKDGKAVIETVSVQVTHMLPETGAEGTTTMIDTSLGLTGAGLVLWLAARTRRNRRRTT